MKYFTNDVLLQLLEEGERYCILHAVSSSEIRVQASRQNVHEGDRLQRTAKSLFELNSMSEENVREKLNEMDGTRPIKYKLSTKKDVQYKTTLSKK